MKLLTLLLESILDEMNIKKKPQLGKGGHKFVYGSEIYKSKDISGDFVMKTWKPTENVDSIIRREYDLYKKNPDMFAPIEKMDFKRRIMIQKKLDIGKAQQELQKLKKYMAPFYKDHPEFVYRDLPEYFEALVEDEDEQEKVREAIVDQTSEDSDMVNVFDRWIEFVRDMFDMDRKYVDRLGRNKDYIVDLHDGNVGYDGDKLKFLDI
jgi:hypothetical protein